MIITGIFFRWEKLSKFLKGHQSCCECAVAKRSNCCIRNCCELCEQNCVSLPAGDAIYGRVMVDPVQNLGDSFFCNIEKVFLCTGMDGYVPKYNPSNFEFGCLADSPSLLYRFKIIVSNKLISIILVDSVQGLCSFILSSSRTRPSQRPRQGHLVVWPSKHSWLWMILVL